MGNTYKELIEKLDKINEMFQQIDGKTIEEFTDEEKSFLMSYTSCEIELFSSTTYKFLTEDEVEMLQNNDIYSEPIIIKTTIAFGGELIFKYFCYGVEIEAEDNKEDAADLINEEAETLIATLTREIEETNTTDYGVKVRLINKVAYIDEMYAKIDGKTDRTLRGDAYDFCWNYEEMIEQDGMPYFYELLHLTKEEIAMIREAGIMEPAVWVSMEYNDICDYYKYECDRIDIEKLKNSLLNISYI